MAFQVPNNEKAAPFTGAALRFVSLSAVDEPPAALILFDLGKQRLRQRSRASRDRETQTVSIGWAISSSRTQVVGEA